MDKNYLIAIGPNCIDEYYDLSEIPIMGDKVVVKPSSKTVGGMIGNAASVYSNYGNSTYMLDILNDEEDTTLILDDLKKYGINVDYVIRDNIGYNSRCQIMLYEGERIIFVQENPVKEIELNREQKELFINAKYIYSTIKDLIVYKDILRNLDDANTKGCELILDIEGNTITNIDEDIEIIRRATHLFINDSGDIKLKELLGENYYKSLFRENVRSIVITLGANGCKVITPENVFEVSGIKVPVVDTTGAGDTFNASFVHGLSKRWDLRKCAEFANYAAARAIQYLGPKSGVVSEEEVNSFIALHRN